MKKLKASFTIEAAVIVPLTMFIIVTFMYMTFYLHDLCVLGSAGISFIMDNAAGFAEGQEKTLASEAEEYINERLIIADSVSVDMEEDDDGLFLSGGADFDVPFGFAGDLLGFSLSEMNTSVNISNLDARGTLLKYKAISDGIDIVTDGIDILFDED